MAVVATAGHVDHGKSTLVRLLTGQEPDRWAEEQRRGLTIDLGYAWTDVDGRRISLVDVPGHEHFTGNMLAGLGPVAAVLFVVAADDGWSAQSQEHARAIAALGIRHVLLAVTRCDLVPGHAARDEARDEALRRLESLGVPVAKSVLVSGATGAGIADLRAALGRLSAAATTSAATSTAAAAGRAAPTVHEQDATRLRLWVDRSFSVRGAGTVVTGTLSAGRIAVGDELVLRGERLRVRGLQSCGAEVGAVPGPARVAVNLRGVEVSQVGRGDALLASTWPRPVTVVDCRLHGVGGPVPQRLPRELTLHVGTAAMAVRTQLRDPQEVRIRLAAPLPLERGDRAVLRDPGRHEVLAGLEVLVVDPPRRHRGGRPATTAGGTAGTRVVGAAPAPGAEPAYRRPAGVARLVAWLAEHPLQAPTRDDLDRWDLDARDLALAADHGTILRIGGVVVTGDAPARAEAAVRQLAQPFSVGDAARAMATSRRVAVPLLERLDAAMVTRRRPDGSRELR